MKKRRMSAKERRQQILDVAIGIFAEFGLDGARTRQIADACGINEALLYKHFPSKDRLFVESMLYMHEKYTNEWWRIIEESPNAMEAIRKIQHDRITMMFKNPHFCHNLLHVAAAATREEDMLNFIRDWASKGQEHVEEMLRMGIMDGSIRPDIDVEASAWWMRSFSIYVSVSIVGKLHETLTVERALKVLDDYLGEISMGGKSINNAGYS